MRGFQALERRSLDVDNAIHGSDFNSLPIRFRQLSLTQQANHLISPILPYFPLTEEREREREK